MSDTNFFILVGPGGNRDTLTLVELRMNTVSQIFFSSYDAAMSLVIMVLGKLIWNINMRNCFVKEFALNLFFLQPSY